MIGRIQGQLVEVSENTILVDTGGVCYELEITSTARTRLPPANSKVALFTHFVVRQDAQLLYGFANREERNLFRTLIRINGVGPKLALNLISSIALGDLARSVQDNDISLLTRVPGVGRKTAQRLLVELKDTLADLVIVEEVSARSPNRAALEAEQALITLGYKPGEARRVVSSVDMEASTTEQIVRAALQRTARQAEVTG
ncbi:MAG: Holliday junction branch migration protein RuvA [Gammaproteobacteria bacterium]|nr:Holliday junction branch migration protein RuvA [Gammaproteobacteria bacterium]